MALSPDMIILGLTTLQCELLLESALIGEQRLNQKIRHRKGHGSGGTIRTFNEGIRKLSAGARSDPAQLIT